MAVVAVQVTGPERLCKHLSISQDVAASRINANSLSNRSRHPEPQPVQYTSERENEAQRGSGWLQGPSQDSFIHVESTPS